MQEGRGNGNESPEQDSSWQPLPDEGDATQTPPGQSPPSGQEPPGSGWVPSPMTGPSGQPGYGQPGQPGYTSPPPGQPWQASPGAPAGAQSPWGSPAPGQQPWGPPGSTQPLYGSQPPPGGQDAWPPLPAQVGRTVPPGGQGQWVPPPPGSYGQPPPEPSTHGPASRALIYLLVAVLAAAIGAGAVFALRGHSGAAPAVSSREVPKPPTNIAGSGTAGRGLNVSAVAGKVEPGMVDITARVRYQGQVFEGTGMVLSSSGLVLTNNHVVKESTSVSATLVSNGRTYPAQIVGTDNTQDVALLKLVGASGLKTVQVGNSAKLRLDTLVVALGNAGGQGGSPTVTDGEITALDRTITASDQGSGTSETLRGMLQTNAQIAEGDSGGPLANAAGQVIGMNTAANTQSLGGAGTAQGFSIPINRALAIAHLIAAGQAGHGIVIGQPAFLGIAIASNPRTDAASTATNPRQQLGQLRNIASSNFGGVNSSGRCLNSGATDPVPSAIAPASSGTLIGGVFCGTPAATAGAQAGDVITAVNGQSVGSPASLRVVMSHYRPGETVSLTWVGTDGRQHTGSLKLAAGPAA